MLTRPAFNILYLAINQKAGNPALANVKVRQAIAHAINREAIVDSKYPEGSTVAINFMPPTASRATTTAVTKYDYNPDKAKALLAEAGVDQPDAEVLLPDRGHPAVHAGAEGHLRADRGRPEGGRHHGRADRRSSGARTTSTPSSRAPTTTCTCSGWTGDYADAYNFIGTFFDRAEAEWGFTNPALFDAVREGRRPGARRWRSAPSCTRT